MASRSYQQYVSVLLDGTDATQHHKDYTYGVETGSRIALKVGDVVIVDGGPYSDGEQRGVVTRLHTENPTPDFRIKPIYGYVPSTKFAVRTPMKADLTIGERSNRRAALAAAARLTGDFVTQRDVLVRAEAFETWLNR